MIRAFCPAQVIPRTGAQALAGPAAGLFASGVEPWRFVTCGRFPRTASAPRGARWPLRAPRFPA